MFTTTETSTPLSDSVILEAIEFNETFREDRKKKDDYYSGRHGILEREKPASILANEKVVVNHAKYITDVNVGYLLGNPVEYKIVDETSTDLDNILGIYRLQNINTVDRNIAKLTSKMGKAFDYTFATSTGEPRTKQLDPRNCIMICDDTLEHKEIAAVIYSDIEKGKESKVTVVTAQTIQGYKYKDKKITSTEQPVDHYFGEIPVVTYKNNEEEIGDFEPVLNLIDAYNILQSDRVNDKVQLVNSMLLLYGITFAEGQLEELKRERVLAVPEDGKAEYVTKELSEDKLDILAKRIKNDIHQISMTPNLSDENFIGNASGVAIRYKLFVFEMNIKNKETYFEEGLKMRFRLYNNLLSKTGKGVTAKLDNLDAIFKRGLPQNDYETAQMISLLDGKVTDQSLIAQLSFVDDPRKEYEQQQKEALERSKQLAEEFGTNNPTQSNNSYQNNQ